MPRRTYENYLLDVDAICAVLTAEFELHDIGREISPADVTLWLKKSFYHDIRSKHSYDDPVWIAKCDAPKLLARLFIYFSDTKIVYRKTIHSVELTKWLLNNKPEAIAELTNYVASLVPKSEN